MLLKVLFAAAPQLRASHPRAAGLALSQPKHKRCSSAVAL